jgi:hypothetical protein
MPTSWRTTQAAGLRQRREGLAYSGSRRLFALSRAARAPWLYLAWARAALALYHGLAYSRGTLGGWIARIAKDA